MNADRMFKMQPGRRLGRVLCLGTVGPWWTLRSVPVRHSFHVHITHSYSTRGVSSATQSSYLHDITKPRGAQLSRSCTFQHMYLRSIHGT